MRIPFPPARVWRVCFRLRRCAIVSLIGPVLDDLLRQAKAQLLQRIPLSESSVGSIAAGFLARTNADLPLDKSIRAAHRYCDHFPGGARCLRQVGSFGRPGAGHRGAQPEVVMNTQA